MTIFGRFTVSVAMLLAAISVQAQRTTTHTDETSNNTSGCASQNASYVYATLPPNTTNPCIHNGVQSVFTGEKDDITADVDKNTNPNTVTFALAPNNLSDKTRDGSDIHSVLNGGASKVFANMVLWHAGPGSNGTFDYVSKADQNGNRNVQNDLNNHLLNGYANNDSNQVKTQIAFMQRLNLDGIVANPPGPLPDAFTGESQKNRDINASLITWQSEAGKTTSFLYSVMTDQVMWNQNCPGGQDANGNFLLTPVCAEKIMICSLDYMNTAKTNTFTCASDGISDFGGGFFADSHYWKVADPNNSQILHPVMSYFVDEAHYFNNCSAGCPVYDDNLNDKTCTGSAQCWDFIFGGINHHISGFSVRPYVIHRDHFDKHSTLGPNDGSFRWFNASTDQTFTDLANGAADSCAYNCWLSTGFSSTLPVILGVALAKVDHAQSHFTSQSAVFGPTADHLIMDAQCGKTWLNYLQAPRNNNFGVTHAPLNAIEIATWDDYDEGTEMETGVDNCMSSLSPSITGSTLSWTIAFNAPGDEHTIDHYAIFYSTDGATGQNLTELADVAVNFTGSYTFALPSNLPNPTVVYVKAVGKPMVTNHMSAGTVFAPNSPAHGTIVVSGTPTCFDGGGCDSGTAQITMNGRTETIVYDGTGTNGPGTTQGIAVALASAFNNDSGSFVTATAVQDANPPFNWDINFVTKGTGNVNYVFSTAINSFGGNDPGFSLTPTLGQLTGGH